MNIKEIKEMIQLMNENHLTEIELEKDGLKIRLKKGAGGSVESIHEPFMPRTTGVAAKDPASPTVMTGELPRAAIQSPMVGTFYAMPAPDAPAFVRIGSQVEVGQVICIIEAMKLMNEIKSEVRGKVTEILVNNGDPVEFNQPLFRLE